MMSATPTYVTQSTRIPRGVCDIIEKLQRNFLRGHIDRNGNGAGREWGGP